MKSSYKYMKASRCVLDSSICRFVASIARGVFDLLNVELPLSDNHKHEQISENT